jgi:flagellar biosynthetic protein FlhB
VQRPPAGPPFVLQSSSTVADKTEAPTPRRLRKAREEGDSGSSAYASQAVAFVVAVALVPSTVRALAVRASSDIRGALVTIVAIREVGAFRGPPQFDRWELATAVAALSFPLLVGAAIAGTIAHALQTGGVIATKKLAPNIGRLDPFAGFKGLFSAARAFAVLRALLTSTVVGWLVWEMLGDHLVDFALVAGRPRFIPMLVREVAGGLAWRAALVGLGIAAVDLVVTRRGWLRRLRMSKHEVRREHRDTEGDPQLKAARERGYRELMAQAAIADVRSASVVVVNPTHLACALRYDEKSGDEAPIVVATGQGELAARIARAAHDHGVPIVRNAPLAHTLVELEAGQAIPDALYEAVAEILREVWDSGNP